MDKEGNKQQRERNVEVHGTKRAEKGISMSACKREALTGRKTKRFDRQDGSSVKLSAFLFG